MRARRRRRARTRVRGDGPDASAFVSKKESGPWWSWWWREQKRPIGSVFYFPSGVPCSVPLLIFPWWHRDFIYAFAGRPLAMVLRRAFRTVFTSLGFDVGTMMDRPSRTIAILLALCIGFSGAHWFYLGRPRRGISYLSMLVIVPMLLSWYDAVRLLLSDRAAFDTEFGKP